MTTRNNGHAMVGLFQKVQITIVGKVTKMLTNVTTRYFKQLQKIARTQGIPGLVKYLKACSVALQQAIAGHKTVTGTRVSRTKSGLPRIIPVQLRRLIRAGKFPYIKFSLTLLSIFRDFIYPSPVKLSSITSPYSGEKDAISRCLGYLPNFDKIFLNRFVPRKFSSDRRGLVKGKFSFSPIFKSSPQAPSETVSFHPITLVRSAIALKAEQIV